LIAPRIFTSLIARKLTTLQLMLCASPDYLARRGTPTTIEELDEHDHVLFTPTSRNQTWTLVGPNEQTAEFGRPARLASNNLATVVSAARAGTGITLISEFMVTNEVQSGSLVVVLPEWKTRQTEAHAVYPARQNVPPRLTLFLDHLTKALNPPPWSR
jgi:DNA-binding transcriptional LysR family regulator